MSGDDKMRDAASYAAQLLPILAMWGIPRETARRAAAALTTALAGMSDAEYKRAAQGMHIKPGAPDIVPAND